MFLVCACISTILPMILTSKDEVLICLCVITDRSSAILLLYFINWFMFWMKRRVFTPFNVRFHILSPGN